MPETLRVLLVEDDPVAAGLFRAQLHADVEVDYRLDVAETLREASAALSASRPDVIALDLMLPDSGGLDTLEEVRKLVPEVPVVVLTGVQDEGLAEAARERGAAGLLIKGRPGNRVPQALRGAANKR